MNKTLLTVAFLSSFGAAGVAEAYAEYGMKKCGPARKQTCEQCCDAIIRIQCKKATCTNKDKMTFRSECCKGCKSARQKR